MPCDWHGLSTSELLAVVRKEMEVLKADIRRYHRDEADLARERNAEGKVPRAAWQQSYVDRLRNLTECQVRLIRDMLREMQRCSITPAEKEAAAIEQELADVVPHARLGDAHSAAGHGQDTCVVS